MTPIFLQTICYWGTGKNRYQLEIPESALKNTPSEYELQSSKKGFKRYWSPEIVKLIEKLSDAEDRRDACLKHTMRKVFHQFDEEYVCYIAYTFVFTEFVPTLAPLF